VTRQPDDPVPVDAPHQQVRELTYQELHFLALLEATEVAWLDLPDFDPCTLADGVRQIEWARAVVLARPTREAYAKTLSPPDSVQERRRRALNWVTRRC
jgi:hypothetical protein